MTTAGVTTEYAFVRMSRDFVSFLLFLCLLSRYANVFKFASPSKRVYLNQ